MSVDPTSISGAFGSKWSEPALFYSYQLALRFELAQGKCWVDRFSSAVDRASEVITSALQDADDLQLAIVRYCDSNFISDQDRTDLDTSLEAYELPPIGEFESHLRPPTIDETDEPYVWEACTKIEPSQVLRAIWAAVAIDFGDLMPTSPGRIRLLSLSEGVLCHPYDDRGMDVIGLTPGRLAPLYRKYKSWLLDYDRSRMDHTFSR